jgi:hypothetical protein
MRRTLFVLLLAGLSAACNPVKADEKVGELGQGKFKYGCVEQGDAACNKGLSADAFPARIALGGRFRVTYERFDYPYPDSVVVSSGSDQYITAENGAFVAEKAGHGVLLAHRTSDSRVMDFVHLGLAPVTDSSRASRPEPRRSRCPRAT